ncbi:unnamed protein product [Aphis gossypii]|uniref:Uncharacterized protein n=1 Tax=Aphis gossypii TaxID=80765 RepID=A0A9P0JAT4_APHGO|nr:unnamed protein product [Aphis gossypii]
MCACVRYSMPAVSRRRRRRPVYCRRLFRARRALRPGGGRPWTRGGPGYRRRGLLSEGGNGAERGKTISCRLAPNWRPPPLLPLDVHGGDVPHRYNMHTNIRPRIATMMMIIIIIINNTELPTSRRRRSWNTRRRLFFSLFFCVCVCV